MAHRALAIIRRRLFDFLTILSLLLCLATVALWVRSHWLQDMLEYESGDSKSGLSVTVTSNVGEFKALVWRGASPLRKLLGWEHYAMRVSLPESGLYLGFWYYAFTDLGDTSSILYFPHWFLALLFAILPAIRLRAILRTRRRFRPGLCPHCGYDLRATPDRCPECGAVAAKPLRG